MLYGSEDFFGAIAGYERVKGLLYRFKGSTAADGEMPCDSLLRSSHSSSKDARVTGCRSCAGFRPVCAFRLLFAEATMSLRRAQPQVSERVGAVARAAS